MPTNDSDNVIRVWLDYTNQQISVTIKSQIISAFQRMGHVIEEQGEVS